MKFNTFFNSVFVLTLIVGLLSAGLMVAVIWAIYRLLGILAA